MKTSHAFIPIALVCLLIQSPCMSQVLYSTVGQNTPLLHTKGDAVFTLGVLGVDGDENFAILNPLSSELLNGVNIQLALSPARHLGIISSIYTIDGSLGYSFVFGSLDHSTKGTYLELGGGLYNYYEKVNLIAELMAGVGFGAMNNEVVNARYVKYFLQPSAGFSTKVFDIAFTPRVAVVNFTAFSESGYDVVNVFFEEHKTTFVFEPGFTARLGYKLVKLQYQLNFTTFKFKENPGANFENTNLVLNNFGSVSLYILLSHRWTNRSKLPQRKSAPN